MTTIESQLSTQKNYIRRWSKNSILTLLETFDLPKLWDSRQKHAKLLQLQHEKLICSQFLTEIENPGLHDLKLRNSNRNKKISKATSTDSSQKRDLVAGITKKEPKITTAAYIFYDFLPKTTILAFKIKHLPQFIQKPNIQTAKNTNSSRTQDF